MKTIFLILLVVLAFSGSAFGQKTADEVVLRVEGGEQILELKLSDLAKMPRTKTTISNQDGKREFEGVELREVLKAAGAKLGKNQLRGAELSKYLLIEAADGYKVVFALAEIDSDYTGKSILLADTRDGKPLFGEEGRLRLIVADDKKQSRWVRQVIALKNEFPRGRAARYQNSESCVVSFFTP